MNKIKIGQRVKWRWGKGEAEGIVKEIIEEKVSKIIKDTEVTRNGTKENPAILIEQKDGDEVLKLASEVE